jgi:guanylate kinase
MISAQTEQLLHDMHVAEKTYRPSREVCDSLRTKNLVMLVGPVAIGKSYVIDQITASLSNFKQIPMFTTREARPDDKPSMFRVRSHTDASIAEIFDEIKSGKLVQYIVHITTGRIYGTTLKDYDAEYNLLPTLPGVVDSLAQLPFNSTSAIYLTARPEVWQMWLNSRYPNKNAERAKRIEEAILSLEWALDDSRESTISWVENSIQTPERTIEDVINIVKYKQEGDPAAREYAKQMLELAISER